MKNALIILGVLYLQAAFAEFTEKDISQTYRECTSANNMTLEEFISTINEDFTVTEGNPNYNSVILCGYRKDNFLNADDTLDKVKFQNFLVNEIMKYANVNIANPEEATANAIDSCKTIEGSDPGDTLVKHYNCVMKYLKKL